MTPLMLIFHKLEVAYKKEMFTIGFPPEKTMVLVVIFSTMSKI